MAYSNKKIGNNPEHFPGPQTWLSWVEEIKVERVLDHQGNPEDASGDWEYTFSHTGDGKVRHHHSMADAKKSLAYLGRKSRDGRGYWGRFQNGTFITSWSVYEWVDDAWVLRFEGKTGEPRNANPLFQLKITKDQQVNPMDEAREKEALAAVRAALARRGAA